MGLTFKLGTAPQVTTNYIPKANSNSFSNSLIFDNGTNIGIGTSSPASYSNFTLLHVAGLTTNTGGASLYLSNSDRSLAGMYYVDSVNLRVLIGTQTNHPTLFITNDTERMRITSTGNVGIGTNNPGSTLQIGVGGENPATRTTLQFSNGGYSLTNTPSSPNAFSNGDKLIFWNDSVGKASVSIGDAYNLMFQATGSNNTAIQFFTGTSGNAGTERMRITSGGSVLINTTTSNQGYPLEIQAGGGGEQIWLKRSAANAQIFMGGGTAAETILFIRANGSNGVYMTANATSWTSNSDETIKDIIEPITDGLDKLKDIRTVIYKFKNDKEGSRKVGLIAQDVEKILPEAITKTYQNEYDKEVLGLNYTDLIPVLVKAIQELSAKVSALENKS
jgi:hypothetical protein